MQKVVLGRTGLAASVMGLGGGAHVILSGRGSVEHLLENVRSLALPALPGHDRARLVEVFAGVEDVSGH